MATDDKKFYWPSDQEMAGMISERRKGGPRTARPIEVLDDKPGVTRPITNDEWDAAKSAMDIYNRLNSNDPTLLSKVLADNMEGDVRLYPSTMVELLAAESVNFIKGLAKTDRDKAVTCLRLWFTAMMTEQLAAEPPCRWAVTLAQYATIDDPGYVLSFKVLEIEPGVDSRKHVSLCSALWADVSRKYEFVIKDAGYNEWRLERIGEVDNATFAALFQREVLGSSGSGK